MLPEAATAYYEAQQRLTVATLGLTRTSWRGMGPDFDSSWSVHGPRVTLLALSAQLGAARAAEPYLAEVLPELGIAQDAVGTVAPRGFVGDAGDGRPVATLLEGAVVTAKQAVAAGAGATQALAAGGAFLDLAVQTLVADTARSAVSAAMVARPAVTGYVRMLQLPSCPRCAVLAGKFFHWNQGFQRHPRCDCQHIPATEQLAGDLTTDPRQAIAAGQVRGLSRADARAILEDGADVSRVVNAQRGMSTAQVAGQRVKVTTEAATRAAPRLRPETIYQVADDRADAVRLLKRFGYLSD